MLIDSNLNVIDHINNIILKISTKISILKSLRKIVPTDAVKQIYNAIVQSHLNYRNAVYDCFPNQEDQTTEALI